MPKKLILLAGPTASGKSKLALKLAKRIKGEIINADSMQVYSNLNILTARPSLTSTKQIKHHLYGYIDGSIRYNVATWCQDIANIIEINNKKNIYSIIVGGTGMYIDKFLNGLIQVPKISENIKKESDKLILKIGKEKFIKEVKRIDKTSFNKISINDTNRLRRIWEVFHGTKKTLTYWLKNKNKKYLYDQKYNIFLFTPNREEIYKNINIRFEKMINDGAIEEVKKLNNLNFDSSLPIMRAHGVPEISKYLTGNFSLTECIGKGQQVTRNYAKRQLTWWRSSPLDIKRQFNEFPSEIDENLLDFL